MCQCIIMETALNDHIKATTLHAAIANQGASYVPLWFPKLQETFTKRVF
jgi:hypothetical protein